jgi:hypothetical protein
MIELMCIFQFRERLAIILKNSNKIKREIPKLIHSYNLKQLNFQYKFKTVLRKHLSK